MNLTGIITEYNPFHKGHLYHLKKTLETTNCDGTICIMSGNFVQRGEPALINKWYRTEMALKNGVDLVLELPLIYATASAEFFAFGSVSLLNNLGVVNNLCFGSEAGDLLTLKRIASILNEEPLQYSSLLSVYLDKGLSYANARTKAIEEYISSYRNPLNNMKNLSEILSSSNNILAIEYLKALLKLKSNIEPFTIKRIGSSYNSKELMDLSSATSIRNHIYTQNNLEELEAFLPDTSFDILKNFNEDDFVFSDYMVPYLKYKAITIPKNLELIPEAQEGLHNKIIRSILNYKSLEEILLNSKSKRYALTRLKRILCAYFIGLENFPITKMRTQLCPYARVLGFNSTGKEILKEMKKKCSVPIITKIPQNQDIFLKLDIQGTNMYSLISNSTNYNEDYYRKPIIIK